jgi:hypothetical protein
MSKEPSTLLLEHHLKALKLPTMLHDYTAVAAACSQERGAYAEFLLRLTERELIERERRAAERRLKEAQFPVVKTIDNSTRMESCRPRHLGIHLRLLNRQLLQNIPRPRNRNRRDGEILRRSSGDDIWQLALHGPEKLRTPCKVVFTTEHPGNVAPGESAYPVCQPRGREREVGFFILIRGLSL